MQSSWSARLLFPPDANLSSSTHHHLHYYLFSPELPAERRVPLLVYLHGGTKPRGRENDTPALPAEAFHSAAAQLRHPCFVLRPITVCRARNHALRCNLSLVSPSGLGCAFLYRSICLSIWQGQRRNWVHGTASPTHVGKPYHVTRVPSQPMLLLMRLLSQTLRTEPSIDPARLVLVGASMGAYGALDLLSRCPHAFAATVAIAGAGDPLFAPPLARARVWLFHAAVDDQVGVNGSRRMLQVPRTSRPEPRWHCLARHTHCACTCTCGCQLCMRMLMHAWSRGPPHRRCSRRAARRPSSCASMPAAGAPMAAPQTRQADR